MPKAIQVENELSPMGHEYQKSYKQKKKLAPWGMNAKSHTSGKWT